MSNTHLNENSKQRKVWMYFTISVTVIKTVDRRSTYSTRMLFL